MSDGALPSDSVAVVIVNFRTPELTVASAVSALRQSEVAEVVIVDNASGDASCSIIRSRFADEPRVRLVESAENTGFGAGNNLGVDHTTSRFVFLLNSDAVLHGGTIAALVRQWHTLDRPGPIAPIVYCADGVTRQSDSIGRFPTPCNLLLRRVHRRVSATRPDFVSGCAMFLDRAEFVAIGGFDPGFFMYFEDVQLCWRFRRTGRRASTCGEGAVTHLGGRSYANHDSQRADYFTAQDHLLRSMGVGAMRLKIVHGARSLLLRPRFPRRSPLGA